MAPENDDWICAIQLLLKAVFSVATVRFAGHWTTSRHEIMKDLCNEIDGQFMTAVCYWKRFRNPRMRP